MLEIQGFVAFRQQCDAPFRDVTAQVICGTKLSLYRCCDGRSEPSDDLLLPCNWTIFCEGSVLSSHLVQDDNRWVLTNCIDSLGQLCMHRCFQTW